jgi:hypothetical protein
MMQNLKAIMEQGVKQLQAKASSKPLISKRALMLGDGTKVVMPSGVAFKGKEKVKKRDTLSPVVRGLQKVVNDINQELNAGAGIIREDGIYGPNTADALVGAISSDWTLENRVAKYAKVDFKTIKNVKYMRSRPNLIRAIYSVLSEFAEDLKAGKREVGVAGRGKKKPQPSAWRAGDPSDIFEGYQGTPRLFF